MTRVNKVFVEFEAIRENLQNLLFFLLAISFLFLYGCAGYVPAYVEGQKETKGELLPSMGFSIQVGAFSKVENASVLSRSLQEKGFDAYYFFDGTKFYKVRFGNYFSSGDALKIAEDLKLKGIITEYIIINPGDYIKPNVNSADNKKVREGLVSSAETFLGVPYYWGGVSNETGFDCSGLAMAVYKLNGLNLPRTVNEQWNTGSPVGKEHLSNGDLVFFSIKKTGGISHVGIYIGDNKFIHAPGQGKKIQTDSLLTDYFQRHFLGARTYLR